MARVLDSEEAARLLRVTPRTLRLWAREAKVPARRIGRAWLFSEEALVATVTGPGGLESEPAPAAGGR